MVKFYSVADLSCSFYLDEIEKVLEGFDDTLSYDNVNKIIEFYNIKCFLDNNIFADSWIAEKRSNYIDKTNKFEKHIGKFFSTVNESSIDIVLREVDKSYLKDFWKLFNKYRGYNRISREVFSKLLVHDKVSIFHVLLFKNMVNYYDFEIRQYLIECEFSAEILLQQYFEFRGENKNTYYFPPSLTHEDKENIIIRYIDSRRVNPNYLSLIYESNNSSDLRLTDKTRLKAKKKYQEEIDSLFMDGSHFSYGVEVSFSEIQNDEVENKVVDRTITTSYSSRWIRENSDYATLLNNFIYLFEFTDKQLRIQHVSKVSNMSVFERMLGVKGRNAYPTGIVFNQINALALLQTKGYTEELSRDDIRIEEVLEWFFEEYLKTEFGVEGFYLTLPSTQSTYLEKCRTIVSEIDSILKQFKLFVEDREIDHELLQLSSEHIFMKNIPSLLPDKYVYPIGEEYKIASHCLFSDQSHLTYFKGLEKSYSCFFDILQSIKINKNVFSEYQIEYLEWLIKNEYLYEDKNKELKLNKRKVWLLRDLYYNDVVCNYYMERFETEIKELELKGMVQFKSSLLSKPEQDYFNYILNKSEFTNGLDLRNRYVHGTQSTDVKDHETDYFTFLRILILIIIKINEEFCLAQKLGIID